MRKSSKSCASPQVGSDMRSRQNAERKAQAETVKIVVWQDDAAWLGYLQEYPDYWTQGTTLDDLREHLVDLYRDVTSGEIPAFVRSRIS